MPRQFSLRWYAWAALIGIAAALCAIGLAIVWVRLGVDPWLAGFGVPPWLGHSLVTVVIVYALARSVKRVMAH